MRATKALTLAMLAGLGCAGCNPSSFNSILDKAPVVVFTPPGSSTGSVFVLPLPPSTDVGTTSAARMLVSRRDTPYLALADFDQNGKVTLSEVESGLYGNTFVSSAALAADGRTILLGTPRANVVANTPSGGVSTMTFASNGAGGYTFNVTAGASGGGLQSHLGISVAAGNVIPTGTFVVVTDNSVLVLAADGLTQVLSAACTVLGQLATAGDPYAFRPVAVGDVMTGGLDEIVLAGQGKVAILQWNPTKNTLDCMPTTLVPGAVVASVAIADFDGDGSKDLALGVPPDKVYVFLGPLDPAATTVAPSVIITNTTATGFGRMVAAYGLPAQASTQLLVADPQGTAGGRSGAGRALLFNVTRAVTAPTDAYASAIFFDSNSDADTGVFGSNLGGLMFNTGLCLPGGAVELVPWATTNLDVLTFFNYAPILPPAPVDPRCFALKP